MMCCGARRSQRISLETHAHIHTHKYPKMLRTPKLNDAETQASPTDVFARINNLPVHRLDELLP
jgi:hypothetical protein